MKHLQKETGLWLTNHDHDEVLESTILSLENELEVTGEFYLHGICGVFALALHNQFGYLIEWSFDCENDEGDDESFEPDEREFDPWEHLIHIYCIVRPDSSRKSLIDIRGITQDADRFFEPFEDFFDSLDYYAPDENRSNELKNKLLKEMGEENLRFFYDCACRMIDLHPDWYRFS